MGQLTLESLVCMVLSCLEWPETVIWRKIYSIICTKKYDLISKCFSKMWQTFRLKSPLVIFIFFFTVDVYSPEFFRLLIIQYGTNKDYMFKNPEI